MDESLSVGMKRKIPDKRLDWRDPDMPVLRLNSSHKMIEVDPDWIKHFYERKIADPFYNPPNWRHDPTYDMKKK